MNDEVSKPDTTDQRRPEQGVRILLTGILLASLVSVMIVGVEVPGYEVAFGWPVPAVGGRFLNYAEPAPGADPTNLCRFYWLLDPDGLNEPPKQIANFPPPNPAGLGLYWDCWRRAAFDLTVSLGLLVYFWHALGVLLRRWPPKWQFSLRTLLALPVVVAALTVLFQYGVVGWRGLILIPVYTAFLVCLPVLAVEVWRFARKHRRTGPTYHTLEFTLLGVLACCLVGVLVVGVDHVQFVSFGWPWVFESTGVYVKLPGVPYPINPDGNKLCMFHWWSPFESYMSVRGFDCIVVVWDLGVSIALWIYSWHALSVVFAKWPPTRLGGWRGLVVLPVVLVAGAVLFRSGMGWRELFLVPVYAAMLLCAVVFLHEIRVLARKWIQARRGRSACVNRILEHRR